MWCCVAEVVLIVSVACVALTGLLAGQLAAGHAGDDDKWRTSWPQQVQLLMSVFIVVPSVYYHAEPSFTKPEYLTLTKETLPV